MGRQRRNFWEAEDNEVPETTETYGCGGSRKSRGQSHNPELSGVLAFQSEARSATHVPIETTTVMMLLLARIDAEMPPSQGSSNGKNGDLLEQESPRCRMPTDQAQISRLATARAQTAHRGELTEPMKLEIGQQTFGPIAPSVAQSR